MRKIALFLALCLSLSLLGGCAKGDSTTAAPPSSTPEAVPSDADGSENEPLFAGDLEDYDFSAPENTDAFDLPLLYAQPFSDGYAWVQYEDEAGGIVTSVIDTNGTICFSLPTGVEPSYMSPFADGYSYYRVGDEYETSYEVIVDTTGNECYRTSNSDGAKSWEHIFGQANGLFAIYLQETGMGAVTHTISMTQADGTAVSSFSNFGSEPPFGEYPLKYSDTFIYLGEGWYQFDGWAENYLNFDQQRIAYSSQVGVLSCFRDGKTLSDSSSKGLTFLDANLNYIEDYPLESVSYLDKDADGGYVVAGDNLWRWNSSYNSSYRASDKFTYYDMWGNKICDVTEYPDLKKRYRPFCGDYAVLYIRGVDGNYYVTAINTQGEIMFEPYELVADGRTSDEYAGGYVHGEYMVIQTSGEQYSLMNMNGELVHSISDDFPGCEISQFGTYSAGFLGIYYTANGKEYQKYYPVAEAAAAGDAVYDMGELGTATEDGENDNASEAGTENYEYTFISGFSIEGKWKSIGDSGFGQAQPGAIVAFDGTNCNFFSPKDSYTLYQDGDTYKLDVTSYLFADTLTFTVNTIDEDHIVIKSGQTVTELERVE